MRFMSHSPAGQTRKHKAGAVGPQCAIFMLCGALALAGVSPARTQQPLTSPDPAARRAVAEYSTRPLSFEPNQGQTDARVQFISRGKGYTLLLAPGEADLDLENLSQATGRSSASRQNAGAETVQMRLTGANAAAPSSGIGKQRGVVNYFIGSDRANWHAGIPTYGEVRYTGVYPGVDLVFYGNQRQLEYDFVVAPEADPARIGWQIDGAALAVDGGGNLRMTTPGGPVGFKKPVAYQMDGNRRSNVDIRFVVAGNQVRFALGDYDRARPLVIDPVLSYATYLGAAVNKYSATDGYSTIGSYTGFYPSGVSNPTQALGIDGEGDVVVVGSTDATDFPLRNSREGTPAGLRADYRSFAAFVTKFNSDGSELIYSTYLSGESDADTYATAVAVDEEGNAYVAGYTDDGTFPSTAGAYQPICGANWKAPGFTRINGCAPEAQISGFVTKIDPTGSKLVYSTFLGGQVADYIFAIAIDASGRAYVTGNSDDYCDLEYDPSWACFPTTAGAVKSGLDLANGYNDDSFITVFNAAGSKLLYSSLVGDTAFNQSDFGETDGSAVTVSSNGDFFVAGTTRSPNLPVTAGAFQKGPKWLPGSCCQGFIAKFKPLTEKGSSLAYLTYLGGTEPGYGTFPSGIAADSQGEIYATGLTDNPKFPVTKGAFQTKCGLGGGGQCNTSFVTKMNAEGSKIVWSTMLGDAPNNDGVGMAALGPIVLDKAGNVYVAGQASSAGTAIGFPQVNPIQSSLAGGAEQAFVSKFNPTGTALLFSTLVGSGGAIGTQVAAGLAVDKEQNIYLAGNTDAKSTVHATKDAFQRSFMGSGDGFVVKIDMVAPTTTKLTIAPSGSVAVGKPIELKATVVSAALSPMPTGEVTFTNGGKEIGRAALNAEGVATVKFTANAAGAVMFKASYAGDAYDARSISGQAKLTVK